MKSFFSAAGAAVAFIGMSASSAQAVSFDLIGGTAGIIPDVPGANALLAPLGLPASLGGVFGARVELDGPGIVTAEFLGFEAGFSNTFTFGPNSFTTECPDCGEGQQIFPAVLSFDVLSAIGGLLPFSFSTSGGGGSVANGSNPDDATSSNPGINFFASIVGAPGARSGQSLLLFFDDDGGNNDDNHDDMVVRLSVSAIPLPAAGWLLLASLAGLGFVSGRRRAA